MKTVWVVLVAWSDDVWNVMGVFETEELANAFVDYKKVSDRDEGTWRVEKSELTA